MDTKSENRVAKAEEGAAGATPRSLALANGGVKTGRDFAALMSALMSDLLDGRIDARSANAVCNAGGKLLKVVEMEHKYGRKPDEANQKSLVLAP